jgi:thiamine biosynthesis lipoprotein
MSALAAPAPPPPLTEIGLDVPAMGGRMRLRVACTPGDQTRARHDLGLLARRVDRWAARLTRFDPASELCRLNLDPAAAETTVGPTLAQVLGWAEEAGRRTDGVVDVTLLDERLAAEAGGPPAPRRRPARWGPRIGPGGRRGRILRQGRFRFDLDGVAKGCIADRALASLRRYPAALVDADGDIAIGMGARTCWTIAVADPDVPARDQLVLDLDRVGRRVLGVATSGVDVHRWGTGHGRHHLIDPSSGRPAAGDVRQCTVVATSAALAEVVAKAIVIRGSEWGARLLAEPDILGAVVMRRTGEVMVTEQVLPWLG